MNSASRGSACRASTSYTACSTPYGDPPLLMTHFPLRRVPEGCVNLHGHLHNATVRGSTRHINVCVEQVHYRPRSLTAIRRLAKHLVRGEVVEAPGSG